MRLPRCDSPTNGNELFHHDFPRHAVQLHEIHALGQFDGFLAIDFLGHDFLTKDIDDVQDSRTFNVEHAIRWIGINAKHTCCRLVEPNKVFGAVRQHVLLATTILDDGTDKRKCWPIIPITPSWDFATMPFCISKAEDA